MERCHLAIAAVVKSFKTLSLEGKYTKSTLVKNAFKCIYLQANSIRPTHAIVRFISRYFQHSEEQRAQHLKSLSTMSESGGNNNRRQSAEDDLYSHCQSESISEDGLREIIERHDNNNHMSDYDFIFFACRNKRVTEGIIQCLLEYFPTAASAIENGWSPLHFLCDNPNVTVNIIQLLIDAAPDSVRSVNNNGWMPLHCLCSNKELDDAAALEILKLLIEKHPEALRHANNDGALPFHAAAAGGRNPEFCRLLIEAYPGSERISDANDVMPLHMACLNNTVATVEYFYKLYPDAINHASAAGGYPIHCAIMSVDHRDDPITAIDVVEFLLNCDPNVKLQKFLGSWSLLHIACHPQREYDDSKIETGINIITTIYDAHPEAIEDDRVVSTIQRYHQQVQEFLNSQLVYSRQAKDHRLMTTPDENGQLPLHTALRNNVRLGSIKLLVKGNPPALQTPDNSGALPLHVACQHHESADVVQYLIGLDATTLDAVDQEGNTALHLACHCARHEIIGLLLDKYDAVSVSKRNAQKKLPIDLLFESNMVEDREGIEYTESVFRLLKAYPEMVMVMNIDMQQQQSASATCSSQNGKKRKFGNEE
eukprot:scaffold2096_cov107-Skeletonema_dohrnii-CCMP3373.AAC.2